MTAMLLLLSMVLAVKNLQHHKDFLSDFKYGIKTTRKIGLFFQKTSVNAYQ
jgi:hypothetical protein